MMNKTKISDYYKIEVLYSNGESYLSDIKYEISRATKVIEFEVYIFEESKVAEDILMQLKQATLRGVIVRLLVDGFGSLKYLSWIKNWCQGTKIVFKVYHPINSRLKFFIWNKRNHRKTIIIDNKIAFVGSINIARVHFASEVAKPWKDLAVKVSGSSVGMLQAAFLKAWGEIDLSIEPQSALKNHSLPISILISLRNNRWRLNNYLLIRFFFWRDLLRRIRLAKNRVWIMNAYFIPHRTLLKSLVKAANSGALVRIVLPSRSDVPITKWATPALYYYLLKRNVRIFEYSKTMLHTKTLLVDDWGLIGSHNLNYRSLMHDLEVEAVIQQADIIKEMEVIYQDIIKQSQEIRLIDVQNLGWWDWVKCRFILMFKYFI